MGNKKYIKSPEDMWKLFEEYRKDVKDNPILKVEYVGRDGDRVDTPLQRPLTFSGFDVFVMEHEGIKSKGVEQYFTNQGEAYPEFLGICSRIKKIIRAEQVDGGMAGIYNSSITQRLNGLVDKQQTEHKGEPRVFIISLIFPKIQFFCKLQQIKIIKDENNHIRCRSWRSDQWRVSNKREKISNLA